jgi:hypothetical protein
MIRTIIIQILIRIRDFIDLDPGLKNFIDRQ